MSGPSTADRRNRLNISDIVKDDILTKSFYENYQPEINIGAVPNGLYLAIMNITRGKRIKKSAAKKMYFMSFWPITNCLSIRVCTVFEL